MCTIQLLSSVFIVDIYNHIVGVDRVMKWQFYFMFIAAKREDRKMF